MNEQVGLRVLHLEDSPRDQQVVRLRRELRINDCKIDHAGDLPVAVRLLQGRRYDCLISDLVKGTDVATMEFQEILDYALAQTWRPTMTVFSAFLGNWPPQRREYWERKGVRVFAKDQVDDLVTSLLANWPQRFRELWHTIPREDLLRRTALTVVHGIVERSSRASLRQAYDWLTFTHERFRTGAALCPEELEAQARKLDCGLQVFDPERDPLSLTGFFGVVQNIENGVATLSIYVRETSHQTDAPVLEAVEVPAVDLPLAYALPGVWVAWVERRYQSGTATMSKGRFEPASELPQDDDQ